MSFIADLHITRSERLLLSVLLIIFLINFHLFQWYDQSYVAAIKQLEVKPIVNRYERIQSEQHYYEIYQIAQKYKGREDLVVLIEDDKSSDNLDYTSRFYANKGKLPKLQHDVYLSELGLFAQYYFYPAFMPRKDIPYFASLALRPDMMIISDTDLLMPSLSFIANTQKIQKILQTDKNNALRVNRRPAKAYYLFKTVGL